MSNNNDKKKILLIKIFIVFVILMIILFTAVAIIDFLVTDYDPKLVGVTTRRTYTTTSKTTTSRTTSTSTIGSTTEATSTSTTSKNSKRATTTSTKKTVSATTTRIITDQAIIIEGGAYTEATSGSTNPNALDDYEWYIVNEINASRVANGLNELTVAVELRDMAETAASIYNTGGDSEVKAYLEDYNSYRLASTNQDITKEELLSKTLNKTSITTKKYVDYIGVGVLKYTNSQNGLPSMYYCIIYE
jgi:hypothetical protein